jgi:hypothetical protein
VSDDNAAELQLGGFDPASVDGDMHMTSNIAREGNFAVKAFSIKYLRAHSCSFSALLFTLFCRYAGQELLHFWPHSNSTHAPYAKAIIDSGTSCLVLPNSWSPVLKNSPCKSDCKLIVTLLAFIIILQGSSG